VAISEAQRRERRRENAKEAAAATGIVAGAVYGRGLKQSVGAARRLSRLEKPGMWDRVHAPDISHASDKQAYRAMYPTANRWVNYYSGAAKIRRAHGKPTTAAHHVLRPYRTRNALDAKILDRAVATAPRRPVMYRGMGVRPGQGPYPFDAPASWSPSRATADMYADSATRHSQQGRFSRWSRNVQEGATEPAVFEARNERGFAIGPFSDRQAGHGVMDHEYMAAPGRNYVRKSLAELGEISKALSGPRRTDGMRVR